MLAVMAPRGPVVLVGHSMGGMTVLSHARQFPQRYRTRIVGAAMISSAAEGVSRSPLGEILKNPALEAVRFAVRYAPKTVHRTRGAAKSVIAPDPAGGVLRRREGQPERGGVLREDDARHARSPRWWGSCTRWRCTTRPPALPTLAKVPTLIACGDRDLLTPTEHSQSMAAALPKSELVIVGGAGHLVQLEQPEAIDDALVRLVERATPSKLVALTRRVRERVAQPWLSAARRAPPSCRPPRTPSRWAPSWARQLRAGDVVVLSGPLGAGKTVLAKGIARGDGCRRAGDLADVRAGPRASARGARCARR